jgi:hypothetical protein
MVLISQEIPPFSLFLFPFWEFFSLSFYTPTTMITGPERPDPTDLDKNSQKIGQVQRSGQILENWRTFRISRVRTAADLPVRL